jgi:hypothetical protein
LFTLKKDCTVCCGRRNNTGNNNSAKNVMSWCDRKEAKIMEKKVNNPPPKGSGLEKALC